MNILNKKLFLKLNIVFLLIFVLSTFFSNTINNVFANNEATQEASSAKASTVSVVSKESDTSVNTITFPQGVPGATISNPYNNVDTSSSSQVLHASASEPVVRLKNTSGVAYDITLEITTWTNGIASSEQYELTSATNIETITETLSADGNTATVATGVSISSGDYKGLYLQLVLSELADVTGTSTLTILGESS